MHFCSEYPPYGSGAGRYFEEISRGLRWLGHFSMVVTSRVDGCPEKENTENGVILRIFDLSDIGKSWLAEKVLDLARDYQIDLIESADRLGEAAVLLRKSNRPPVMVNCRYNDVVYRARFAQAWYGWQKVTIQLACLREWRRMRRERYSLEHADLLAAPSEWMMTSLEAQGVRLPRKRAVLIKPLASIPNWKNDEHSQPVILLVGRIDIGKGVGYLRDVLERVSRYVPDICLEIAGGDSYARGLGSVQKWTEQHLGEQRDRVRFLGQLNASQIDEAYRRAWVVIIPSRWDTSPTVLLEAMVRAKSVVVSPFGGMSEYLGGDDWVADPATPEFAQLIVKLLMNNSIRLAEGERLRKRAAAKYTQEAAATAYIDFVSSMLATADHTSTPSQS